MNYLTRLAAALAFAASSASSEEAGGDDLRSAVQNPISSLVSVPLKFGFDNGAPNGDANSLTIQPVIPVTVGDINLINRFIIPLYDAPGGVTGLPGIPGGGSPWPEGRATGLGDINYSLYFSPTEPTNGGVTWGVGPSLTVPTASDNRLGTGKWSGGLSAIALKTPKWGSYGGLVRQLWSFAGDEDRKDVSQTLVEPFINYNLDDGWYVMTDMVITYDWKADSKNALTLPIGGGVGKLFKVGDQTMNAKFEAYYNVERPETAPEWNMAFTVQFLFPK